MKTVIVTFANKLAPGDLVTIPVKSNNLPMGRSLAQYELWRRLGAKRYGYRTIAAAFADIEATGA